MADPGTTRTAEQSLEEIQALLTGPAGTPPAGVRPNFINPPNLDVFVTLTVAICVTFATLAFLIRMYTKVYLVRLTAYEDFGSNWRDHPIYIDHKAWWRGSYVEYTVENLLWATLRTAFPIEEWVNISAIVYCPTVFFVKLSILLQYLRIFVPARKGNMFMFVGAHICIWSTFVFYLFNAAFEIAMCNPREKIWNPLMTTGHCFNNSALFLALGIFNVLSDFGILVLPMPSLWKLQMPLKRKILMTAIFATGLFACVASIIRTYYTWKIVKDPDVSYNMIIMGLWTYVEIAVGLIVSCLPVVPRFFQHFGPKIYGSFVSGSQSVAKLKHKFRSNSVLTKIDSGPGSKTRFAKRSGSGRGNDGEMWNEEYSI